MLKWLFVGLHRRSSWAGSSPRGSIAGLGMTSRTPDRSLPIVARGGDGRRSSGSSPASPSGRKGGQIEAGLKAFFGALLAAGGMFAVRTWVKLDVDLAFAARWQRHHRRISPAVRCRSSRPSSAGSTSSTTPPSRRTAGQERQGSGRRERPRRRRSRGRRRARRGRGEEALSLSDASGRALLFALTCLVLAPDGGAGGAWARAAALGRAPRVRPVLDAGSRRCLRAPLSDVHLCGDARPERRRGWALTFDDGPESGTTLRVLDALDAVGAKATL